MDDREIAKRAIDFQNRAKDYRMMDLPGYMEWSQRRLAEGVSDALIAHLDATGMTLLPEDAAKVSEADFEELLKGLIAEFGE